ncbi:transcriptional regulator, TetR family [Cohaesibacter sp. ES.047]|uniref:TetR/AcrR family transcriptional regulator n=1 Tax=Cohaesibacter sp. ES.047 TaxID=1798205 RepID=UPI000BC0DF83|nr:TetR/AcrR family transcriptional regulator [Cohaesibacter sp. ES.047]SNY90422.1 transcriptional regulator, TetR family [Cohaesibacter sp. ES.047]
MSFRNGCASDSFPQPPKTLLFSRLIVKGGSAAPFGGLTAKIHLFISEWSEINRWYMARPRKHDQDQILDAVEHVIARDGVLTIDAVAKVAGVSKATVLYEHTSKPDLVAALVDRTIKADNAYNASCQAEFASEPDAPLRGRVEAARRNPPMPGENGAVLSLVSALMQDTMLRARFRENQSTLRQELLEQASHPRAARLAWLALEGLKFQQHLELHDWTEAERAEVLQDIETLARQGMDTCEDRDA